MKHVKLFEAFINEAKDLELDKNLAEITLRKMIEKDGDRPFSEEVYLSLFDREDIHQLASSLDDIADYIYASAKKINFNIFLFIILISFIIDDFKYC